MVWDWKKTAEDARRHLAVAKHGGREAALKAAGGETDVNTVRRAVAALDFLDRVKLTDPECYDVLKDSSFGVAEIFSRWWSIDPAGAAVGVLKWRNGELTTRALGDAMRERPSRATEKADDKSLAQAFSEHVEPRLRYDIEAMLGVKLTRSENKRPKHLPPVDFRYSFKDSFDGRDRQIGAIVVGPYQNETIYRKRRHDWMLKALGLVQFFDWVFVVLPRQSALDDYEGWLHRARAEMGELAYDSSADPTSRLRILVIQ